MQHSTINKLSCLVSGLALFTLIFVHLFPPTREDIVIGAGSYLGLFFALLFYLVGHGYVALKNRLVKR